VTCARLLSEEAENFLVKRCVAFEALANPLGAQDLRLLGQIIGQLDEAPSTGWVASFRNIHAKDIRLRKGKSSHKRKTLMAGYPAVCAWVNETEKVLELVVQESLRAAGARQRETDRLVPRWMLFPLERVDQ